MKVQTLLIQKNELGLIILRARSLTRILVLFQVPLFQHMDDLVLENICDRVKSLIFTKGEVVRFDFTLFYKLLYFTIDNFIF